MSAPLQRGGATLRANFLPALVIVLVAVAVAVGGSLVTDPESLWYQSLDKPGFMPPGWAFGVAWTVIYSLTAVAAWVAWLALGDEVRPRVMGMFAANAALNIAWTLLFFGAEAPLVASFEILGLLASIFWLIAALWTRVLPAALLLVPYALWVSFASVLSWSIALMN